MSACVSVFVWESEGVSEVEVDFEVEILEV